VKKTKPKVVLKHLNCQYGEIFKLFTLRIFTDDDLRIPGCKELSTMVWFRWKENNTSEGHPYEQLFEVVARVVLLHARHAVHYL